MYAVDDASGSEDATVHAGANRFWAWLLARPLEYGNGHSDEGTSRNEQREKGPGARLPPGDYKSEHRTECPVKAEQE